METTTSTAPATCGGCAESHHERCTGWTRTYLVRADGALALKRCECARCNEPNGA